MFVSQFWRGLRNYGPKRLFVSPDFVVSIIIWLSLVLAKPYACSRFNIFCIEIVNEQFLQLSTQFAISLTAFILAGLSILISFTNRDFLTTLRQLGIYERIMFIFQYNLYLTGCTALIGILVNSYGASKTGFFVFLFFFIYMIFSIFEMIDLIVSYGRQKARYEHSKE